MTQETQTRTPARQRLRTFRAPVLMVGMIAVLAAARMLDPLSSMSAFLGVPIGIASAIGAVYFYRWFNRKVDDRQEIEEITRESRWKNLGRGASIGAAAFTLTILIIGMFGGWEHVGGGTFGGFLISMGLMTSVATNEELLFRGVIFRIMEERIGTVLALVVSSVIFGLTHLVNPGATLWGTLAIAIEGGTLTGAAYVLTRSVWLPIGIHFAWNFAEAGIFGVPTSGTTPTTTLWHTTLSGPELLTGGAFGPEASLLALIICAIPTVIMLRLAARRGQIRKGQLRRGQ
jgi:uncharacterized protein